MPNAALAELTASLSHRAEIRAEDVLALRRLVWSDGQVSREEADALMALNAACPLRAREWIDYFVEVMVDYLVRQQQPSGYIDGAKAGWLMQWIDADGRVDSLAELELLVKVVETAESVPEALRDYALRQIETAVLSGEGPTRRERTDGDGRLDATCINSTETDLLRRVIYAVGGSDGFVVSTAEADMLFRIKDATLGAGNAPEFADLFVKAVANHLMAHRNYDTLSRSDQLRLDRYMADTQVSFGRFFRRAIGLEGPALSAAALAIPDQIADEAAAAADHALTPAEITWTVDRVRTDGHYDTMEKALIDFLRAEGVVPAHRQG